MPVARQKSIKKKNVNKKEAATVQTRNPVPASKSSLNIPGADTAFKVLLSARFCAAIWSIILDCDETFNYWEPLHYLVNGQGLQTWEYSPEYALRSYTYLLIHGVPAFIYQQIFNPSPMLTLYFIRCMLGLLCATTEVYLYRGICREFGVHVGRMWLIFQLFCPGMFIAGTAFLPSSFSMYFVAGSMAAWLHQRYVLAIFLTVISTFLGWPFAALLGVPIAFDMLLRRRKLKQFIVWSLISAVTVVGPMILIDSIYFGKFVVAPLNIILYNVFTSHGPNLYGVEPPTFYLINGFLNFNIIWVLALCVPVLLVLNHIFVPAKSRSTLNLPPYLSLSPLFLWLIVFTLQPHKEERFLFPVYPLITLCGAISLDILQKLYFRFRTWRKTIPAGSHYLDNTLHIAALIMIVCTIFGISRIFALYKNYHAPMDLMMEFQNIAKNDTFKKPDISNVCVGKDWYRFQSSFFFPNNNYKIRFLKSEFKGILPAYYGSESESATSAIHPYFNDLNQENVFMYFNYSDCNYLLDLDTERYTTLEPDYKADKDWTILKSIPFLDSERSDKLFRAFYVPFVSERFTKFNNFNLMYKKTNNVVKKILQ